MEWAFAIGILGGLWAFLWWFRKGGIDSVRNEILAAEATASLKRVLNQKENEEKISYRFDKLRRNITNDWDTIDRVRRKSGKIKLKDDNAKM